jgi:hypothetical protein
VSARAPLRDTTRRIWPACFRRREPPVPGNSRASAERQNEFCGGTNFSGRASRNSRRGLLYLARAVHPTPADVRRQQGTRLAMTCLACHWIHTNPHAAIACYRRAYPLESAKSSYQGLDTASPESRPVSRLRGRRIQPVFRDGAARPPGRPRVPEAVQRQRTRDRARAYRQRRRAVQIAKVQS